MSEHLAIMIRRRAKEFAGLKAYGFQNEQKQWEYRSWEEFVEQIDTLAVGLLELGIAPKTHMAIFAQNCPEWTIADFAILSIRGVVVPMFATISAEQAKYILEDSDAKVVFVGGQAQYDAIKTLRSEGFVFQKVIVMDASVKIAEDEVELYYADVMKLGEKGNALKVQHILAQSKMTDLASLIYTSGSSGIPKGVMLDHENFAFSRHTLDLRIDVGVGDTSLAFLPLSHVYERGWTYYMLSRGVTNAYLSNPREVMEAFKAVKPTLLCSVPRLYEKIYSTIYAKLEEASPLKRKIFHWSVGMGEAVLNRKNAQRSVPLTLKLRHKLAEKLVLKKLREVLGGNIKSIPCGGGKLSPSILRFFHAVGMPIRNGYGMTETTALISSFEDTGINFQSIGKVMPEMQVKLGAKNEILVKAPNVMKGYYKMPEETKKVLEGGWLHTGDIGRFDSHGNLVFEERLKDLMKTSGGKYIAPQMIESKIGKDQFIEQIAVIGDEKKYVTALIVPAYDVLEEWAKKKGVQYNSMKELIENSTVADFMTKRIANLQCGLAKFEKIQKFKLLSKGFSQEKGELTPTLKIKRKVIDEHFKKEIEEMYDEPNKKRA
ncbi:long-chain fatty acid--CoA ligase [Persicobacter psychrovividus]|uniref:Long-chain-fatty-acid--CoA ligase n=1 Tax=Persicobacter psychrovividus TaxID=387638 RepID=A0ABM7VDJ8_9BACT|nr:long-chain-fatty-acid--CoA ligase [Persicobacter psychrovividus]